MTTTTKFCTVDDVKAQLNTMDGYTGDDAGMEAQIINATALIRSFTRRQWEEATYTQYFNTQDINVAIRPHAAVALFSLNEKPVQSITTVKFHTGGDFENAKELVEGIEYKTDIDNDKIILYPSYMSSRLRSLEVVYVAGYPINDTDAQLLDVDSNLRAACAIQSAFLWRRIINETSGTGQKQDRKGFMNYKIGANGLIMEAQAMLRSKPRLLMGTNG